jgi:hypothetical protein
MRQFNDEVCQRDLYICHKYKKKWFVVIIFYAKETTPAYNLKLIMGNAPVLTVITKSITETYETKNT